MGAYQSKTEIVTKTGKPKQRAGLDIRSGMFLLTFLNEPQGKFKKRYMRAYQSKTEIVTKTGKPKQRAGLDIRSGMFLLNLPKRTARKI